MQKNLHLSGIHNIITNNSDLFVVIINILKQLNAALKHFLSIKKKLFIQFCQL